MLWIYSLFTLATDLLLVQIREEQRTSWNAFFRINLSRQVGSQEPM
jgi:hypothetical protein